MIKIIATFPILLSTLSIPANINVSIITSKIEINNYKKSNLLISYGGGGGGGDGNSPKAKAKRKARQEIIKLLFKLKQAIKKLDEGRLLTEQENISWGLINLDQEIIYKLKKHIY